MSEVPLGEGMLDLPKIMSALLKGNPNLKFSLEMMTRDPQAEGSVPDGALLERFPGGQAGGSRAHAASGGSAAEREAVTGCGQAAAR